MDKNLPEIKIGGRDIPLYYSTYETIAIQREIGCTAFQLKEKVFGMEIIDEEKEMTMNNIRLNMADDPEKIEKLGKLICIIGNAGLEEEGKEPDLTHKWVLRNIKPSMLLIYAVAMMSVISQGNTMEAKEEQKGPVDEIKEEEEAKKPQGN